MNRQSPSASNDFSGYRVLILAGQYQGEEGICLGRSSILGKWSVSPDSSNAILELEFEKEFGLLVDTSGDSERN